MYFLGTQGRTRAYQNPAKIGQLSGKSAPELCRQSPALPPSPLAPPYALAAPLRASSRTAAGGLAAEEVVGVEEVAGVEERWELGPLGAALGPLGAAAA